MATLAIRFDDRLAPFRALMALGRDGVETERVHLVVEPHRSSRKQPWDEMIPLDGATIRSPVAMKIDLAARDEARARRVVEAEGGVVVR
jgi:hypothetical protein